MRVILSMFWAACAVIGVIAGAVVISEGVVGLGIFFVFMGIICFFAFRTLLTDY